MHKLVVLSTLFFLALAFGAHAATRGYIPDPADPPWASCAGAVFPVASLGRPARDQRAHTPSAHLLRKLIRHDEFLSRAFRYRGWRLLHKTRSISSYGSGSVSDMVTFVLQKRGGRWRYRSSAYGCSAERWRAGVAASPWRLDPAFTVPEPGDRELHLLVSETNCASGQRANGRVQFPDLFLDGQRVVIGMFVKPAGGAQTCQSNPATPYRIVLPEPLGARQLLDGRSLPPGPPTQAEPTG